MTNRRLGIGIVGAGNIIKRHALAYGALPESARLIAIADIDLKRAKAAKTRFGFDHAHDDYQKLLARDDVDVVDICTPANHHARMVIDALQAGKHVLCEKPLATTLAQTDEIIQAADQHPALTVSCVLQLRSDPTHRRVRLMIQQGHIGRALFAHVNVRLRKKPAYYSSVPGRGSWKTDGGGVLINQAIHQLDALIYFLGDPVAVSAVMATFTQPIEAEDTIAGWVKFSNGAFATIDCTVCAHSKSFAIEVLGENAMMSLGGNPDANSFDWKIKAASGASQSTLKAQGLKECPAAPADPRPWTVAFQKTVSKLRGKSWIPPGHWGHTPFIREFLIAAQTGSPGPVPPREARRSVELAAALYESALTGHIVSLPLDSKSRVYRGVQAENMGENMARAVRPKPRALAPAEPRPT